MGRIAILAPFSGMDPGYSLCSVVLDQADGLSQIGHEVEIWTLTSCVAKVPTRNTKQIVMCVPVHAMHTGQVDGEKVDSVQISLESGVSRFRPDAIVTHDTIFQEGYITVMEALNRARNMMPDRFSNCVHFIHSVTSDEGLRPGARAVRPGDRIVFGDRTFTDVVARSFGVPESDVRFLAMPRDYPLSIYASDDITALARGHSLGERDIVQVFPASQPRLESKGLRDCIAVFESLKQRGKNVCLIVADAHAKVDGSDQYASQILGDDLVFTSKQGVDRWLPNGLNSRELSELRGYANLFLWPSRYEMSPLAVREAMLSRQLMVLNASCPSVREFGQDDCLYYNWHEYRCVGEAGPYDYSKLTDEIIKRLDADKVDRARRRAMQKYSAIQHARELAPILGV